MSTLLSQISSGRLARAQRIVIYAPEGFGKSTLASQFPAPLFLDLEDGTTQLDVTRLGRAYLPDLQSFESALTDLISHKPCGTIVVDTIDALEQLAIAAVIAETASPRIRTIEDFACGKGYLLLRERIASILAKLDTAITAGLHVVLLAHARVSLFAPPGDAAPYDRFELKLTSQIVPLIKQWADLLLFGNWSTPEPASTETEAPTTPERLLHCNHNPACDAKNRHHLPDTIPWSIAPIEQAFRTLGTPWSTPSIQSTASTQPPTLHPGNDPELARICEPHSDLITSYLLANHRIKTGEDWRAMSPEFANRVKRNPAGFLKVVSRQEVTA